MNDKSVNGVVTHSDESRHNDYLFRISLKAVIINDDGQVLIVKESGRDWWDIPGGGLDHGESIKDTLTRELREEVGFVGNFDYKVILAEDPRLMLNFNLYQTRITFAVKPDNFNFEPGDDGDEIRFINPDDFKDSDLANEQKIYEYSQLALAAR